MARYRLTYDHHAVIDGIDYLLPAGTEVGDGTSYPWHYTNAKGELVDREPSMCMEGLDDEGKARVAKRLEALNVSAADKELLRLSSPSPVAPPPPAAGAGMSVPKVGDVPGSGIPASRASRK